MVVWFEGRVVAELSCARIEGRFLWMYLTKEHARHNISSVVLVVEEIIKN